MSYKTPEEVEQAYVNSMGPELGSLFHELSNECSLLHWKWGEYVILFGSRPERIDLLNEAAGAFFRLVQDNLLEGILLHIARLTDPKQSAGKKNLTLHRLPILGVPNAKARIDECSENAKFARDWRNRHIAHRDLGIALGENSKKKAEPLPPANQPAVQKCLDSIAKVLNGVQVHYCHSDFHYELTSPLPNAESLLYMLRDGIEANRARRERRKSGMREPGDMNPWRKL